MEERSSHLSEGETQKEGTIMQDGSIDTSLNARRKKRGLGRIIWPLIGILVVIALAVAFVLIKNDRHNNTAEIANSSAPSSNSTPSSIGIGLRLAPITLDIRHQSGAALDQVLIGNVYEGLLGRDEHNQIVPALAKTWKVSSDGLTYTFTLHRSIKFSNGHPLTAQDVVWSLDQLRKTKALGSRDLHNVTAIKAPDDHTVVITLSQPYIETLWALTGRAGLVMDPQAKFDPKTQAIGSGPFLVDRFVPNDVLVLKANPHYWGANKAKTKEIVIHYYNDPNAAVNALASRTVDVIAPIEASMSSRFSKDPKFVVKAGEDTDKFVLAFNYRKGPAANLRVRQAVRYAIDRAAIIASRGGVDAPLGGPIPSLDPGYEDLTHLYPYDVQKAQESLKKIGYGPNKHLKLRLEYPNTYGPQLGQQLKGFLSKAYMDLDVHVVEFSTWLHDVYRNHDFDLSLVDHNEPHDIYHWADPKYYYGASNPQIEAIYANAMEQTDPAKSAEKLKFMAELLSGDAAADWLFNYRVMTARYADISGFPINLNQIRLPLWNVVKKTH